MKPTLVDAILSLIPDAQIGCIGTTITWHYPAEAPVTDEQIQAELERLEAEYAAIEYKRLRAAEYPAVGDQLDALFHAGIFPPEMTALLQAVKDKYPKPN